MGLISMGVPQDITLRLASLGGAKVFVESGTFHGGTTKWAAKHFSEVHTIERDEQLFRAHRNELTALKGVETYLGDSREKLPEILGKIGDQSAVFWLDGHWSGTGTAGERDECPLLGELQCLSERCSDIILIDDARFFLSAPPPPHDPQQWPTLLDIMSVFSMDRTACFMQVIDDVIFIVPQRDPVVEELIKYAQTRAAEVAAQYDKDQNSYWSRLLRALGR
ncbi:MAG TPA: hypothetical protein PLG04_05385 [Anaerolineaceae bacterium]|nr:hypothetical protein [Anaerolineaceae bacterium]